MPSSPFLFHSGFGVIASISVLTLLASLLTLIASTFLLWRYRRTVARLMSAQATGAERGVTTGLQSAPASKLASGESVPAKARPVSFSPENRLADRLYRLTISEPRRHACKYALAGVLFALLMGLCGFFAFSQTQINYLRAAAHPFQFLFVFWIFAWPIVLTTNIVGASSERNRWLILLSYFAVLVMVGGLIAAMPTEASVQAGNVILPAWSGETPIRLVSKWSLFNLPPTLLFITFRQRHVRAVAPLVLSFMTIVSIGVLSIIAAAFIFKEASVAAITFVSKTLGVSEITAVGGYFLLLFIVACLLFGLLGWRLVAWMRSGYEQKTLSDQTLGIDALWLIFASFYAAILAFAGPGWALAAPVAFLIFKIVVSVGNKKLHSKSDGPHHDPALLVLRVFSIGKRSELLFDAVTKHWRYVGDVRLIAGTDLALSTVAPHQFLAFVSGKLNQLFVRSEAAIDRTLSELDIRRDADGRFRINDLFCHANTWQSALSALARSTDVVLMDLRNLAENNAGCVFEIRQLLNAVSLGRLVFVVDDTTDKSFLKRTLADTWCELRPDSPNVELSSSALQPFELKSLGHRELQNLLLQLCIAAGRRNYVGHPVVG